MSASDKQQSIVNQIRQHSRQLVRELDVVKGVYLDSGYTFTQCHVLFEISVHQSIGLIELANKLLIDKSNASRTVKKLTDQGLIKSTKSSTDSRQKFLSLTAKGEKALRATINLADEQVSGALENLSAEQQQTVIDGVELYGNALRKGRLQIGCEIRPIQKKDNTQVAEVIRDVMTEFGAVGEGYSIGDEEVDDMFGNYRTKDSCYFVIARDGEVLGAGGVAQLKGEKKTVCELRKMFFRPEIRGIGIGSRLLRKLLDEARARDYRTCYLETLERMSGAIGLYEKYGFVRLKKQMGQTGHCSCDRYYALEL